MTQEEQIIKAAEKDSEIFYEVNDNYGDCVYRGFIDGATWAGANPQFSKEEFIEKACEWLEQHVNDDKYYSCIGEETLMPYLIEDFKKAMEE